MPFSDLIGQLHYLGHRGITEGWKNWSGGAQEPPGGSWWERVELEKVLGELFAQDPPPPKKKQKQPPRATPTSSPAEVLDLLGRGNLEPTVPPFELSRTEEHGGGHAEDICGMLSPHLPQKDFTKFHG